MDVSETTTPKSDQLNADDLLAGAKTYTITKVTQGTIEQPVEIHLAEIEDRSYKPSKLMRRVLVYGWGKDSDNYVGRQLTLFRDADVMYAGIKIGGIKISHMSHLYKPIELMLTVSRGKRAKYIVEPIAGNTTKAPAEPNVGERIGVLMNQLGMTESAIQLAYVGDVVERPITSPTQLTHGEADRVIAYLQKDVEQMKFTPEAKAEWAEGDEVEG